MAERTRGQRWADAVTSFGGSWGFICAFVGVSAVWVLWNSLGAYRPDPYPFLFLNMMLTVVSTFQQPFVLLSQNRQNEEDRHSARRQGAKPSAHRHREALCVTARGLRLRDSSVRQ